MLFEARDNLPHEAVRLNVGERATVDQVVEAR